MKLKIAMLACAALFLTVPEWVLAKTKARAKNKPRPQGQARAASKAKASQISEADRNLVNFSVQPFSDHASHITALRKNDEGFASWEIISAMAFGSKAARPHPAKKLVKFRIELQVGGATEPLFPKSNSGTADDFPRWSMQRATDGNVSAEATLLYPEADTILLVANFKNSGKSTLTLRPRLVVSGGGADVDIQASLDPKSGVLMLGLDRSKLVQRKLRECVAIVAGSGKSDGIFSADSMGKAENLGSTTLAALGGFTVTQAPALTSTLRPGQTLRFPVLLSFAPDEKNARLPLSRLWSRWALPSGVALSKAKARWSLTSARLPTPVDPKFERLSKAAALTVLMNQYGKRSELKNDMISQAKGFSDGFFSEGMPLAALGMSELDHGAAEAALLELSSFSAAAPAPVPPHSGEELLHWEAAGLPLHGLVALELYQRDPQLGRAGDFLKGMGLHLRNECAWWPKNRDGDGNGLYAFGSHEERPVYQQLFSDPAELPTYNLALSSLVAWQMQAASALAMASEEKDEADKLMAESMRISSALKKATRSDSGTYEQGLDGLLPYILGLDRELGMARSALSALTHSASLDLPFSENGIFHPWQAYFMLKGLNLYGEAALARSASAKILAFLDSKSFFSAYRVNGEGLGSPGDASTAALALEMSLERQEQEAFLLEDTVRLSGRLLQVRNADGSIYLKRVGLGEAKASYDLLSLESPGGGPILTEGAFILSADKDMRLSLMSRLGLDITEEKSHKELFKGTKRADMILKAKIRYLVKINKSA